MGLRKNKNAATHQKAATVTGRAADERKQETSTRLGILYNLHFIVKPFRNFSPQSIIDVFRSVKTFI